MSEEGEARDVNETRSADMDGLPVEVIGNILSHLAAARDVVIASATCRKWREAVRRHLHTLCFSSVDWPGYRDHPPEELEVLITQTIMQTSSLEDLSICLGHTIIFSAAPVVAWLMYTRESLRILNYMIQTKSNVNVLERCGKQRLESLVLGYTTIAHIDPVSNKFPVLRSLTLSRVTITAVSLNLLLSACPKLESLSLCHTDVGLTDPSTVLDLCSPSLRAFALEELGIDSIVLEADKLESLYLKDCRFELFELVSKGSLRALKIDDVSMNTLELGESTDLLEVVDVKDFNIQWTKFYDVISKASKLRNLRLWGLTIEGDDENMDLETIALSFPKLQRLALNYDLVDGVIHQALRGTHLLERVVWLELGATVINELFAECIGGVLERCPALEKLVVHGHISEAIGRDDYQMIARFTTCLVKLMRRYTHVDIDFEYR
ncbi:hypothetical protein R1sor_006099 [Riccia sorocarpa]|uniref:F-box domain-containing protein n=1 Tax=Riccia sorocarpa TaxID=122646 RepID=A0ABD3HLG1_9MARC